MSRITPNSNPHMHNSRPHRKSNKLNEVNVSLLLDLITDLKLEVKITVNTEAKYFIKYSILKYNYLPRTAVETKRHQAEWT